jgi:hypothetical protein
MLDFGALQTAIRTWATATVSVPVVWENDPRPFLGKLPVYVTLTEPAAITAIGEDYTYLETNEEDPLLVDPILTGIREFTVLVRVQGRSQTANRSSRYYAEILRTSIKKPSVKEHFRANEIAIVRALPINNFDAPFDNRWEPVSAFELRLACALVATADTAQDTIGSVELSSTLENVDGIVLPVPPNLDEFPISEDD